VGLQPTRIMKFLCSIAALAATCTAFAQGPAEAILGYTGNIVGFFDTTAGWTFQTARIITVTELGCFAKVFDQDPAVTAIQVGLWDHNGSLLASSSVTPRSILFDQTRYESIASVALSPGQIYHLGVYYSGGGFGLDVAGAVAGGSVSTPAEITVRATALAAAGFAFPPEETETLGSLYAGPNFRFQSLPTLKIQPWPVNQVRLSWSSAYPEYSLQSELGLAGAWADAGLPVTVVSNQFVAFDTIGPGSKYYRLLKSQSQPTLSIQPWPGGQVRISWRSAYSGYILQSEPGLAGTWTSAGLPVTVVGNQFVVFDTIGPGSKYYRLIK
jgi:hypothetical protein